MQRITNNISANLTSTQATEKAMYNMGKLGFILSLFSILGSGVISPASLIISCIGATYRQTKLTTAGIIISFSHVVTILNRLLFCLLLPLS